VQAAIGLSLLTQLPQQRCSSPEHGKSLADRKAGLHAHLYYLLNRFTAQCVAGNVLTRHLLLPRHPSK
jgi:hypothetical protein